MPPKNLLEIKKSVDPDLVQLLENCLRQAKEGKLQGVVMFLNLPGNEFSHAAAGDMQLSEALMAFESWKWEQCYLQHRETGK